MTTPVTTQELVDQQKHNTLKAYKRQELDYDKNILNRIAENGQDNKLTRFPFFTTETQLTFAFERKLNQDELEKHYLLKNLPATYPDFSFSFASQTITNRETGHCQKLEKFLKANNYTPENITEILEATQETRTLIISANPWVLIGSSVGANGNNDMSSCHHPGSDTESYKSGAISYCMDSTSVMFGVWDNEDKGLSGRNIVYITENNTGMVTTRNYGNFTDTDCSFLRTELYKLLGTKKSDYQKTKDFTVIRNGFCGYLDTTYFIGYRTKTVTETIKAYLTDPTCPNCGYKHDHDNLVCSNCDDNGYTCCECGDNVHEDDMYYINDRAYCNDCLSANYFYCKACGEYCSNDKHAKGTDYCKHHAERKGFYECSDCSEWYREINETVDGDIYCDDCLPSDFVQCYECNLWGNKKYIIETIEGEYYCTNCSDKLEECPICGEHTTNGLNTEEISGHDVIRCDNCNSSEYVSKCTCGTLTETFSPCSDKCANNALFSQKSVKYNLKFEMINIIVDYKPIQTRTFYTRTYDGIRLDVTEQYANKGHYTITEYSTGQTSSCYFCDTLYQAINKLKELPVPEYDRIKTAIVGVKTVN